MKADGAFVAQLQREAEEVRGILIGSKHAVEERLLVSVERSPHRDKLESARLQYTAALVELQKLTEVLA